LESHGLRFLYVIIFVLHIHSTEISTAGSWDPVAGHQANLHGNPLSVSTAVDYYIGSNVMREKLVVGIPLYGRSFANTEGPGKSFNGGGPGTWEAGVYDYRVLPLPGSSVRRDANLGASWSYDQARREFISFDDEGIAAKKGRYIARENLGGSMFWELSGDKNEATRESTETGFGKDPQPGKSLVKIVKENMGTLDSSTNWLIYNRSQFDNMKAGMP